MMRISAGSSLLYSCGPSAWSSDDGYAIRSGAFVFGVVRFLSFIWIIRFSLFTLCCSFRRLGELAVVLKTQNEIQSNHRKSRSLAKSIRLQTNGWSVA